MQVGPIELRPVRIGKVKFCVGKIPQQKVADSVVAACADTQVGLRNVAEREITLEHGFINCGWIHDAGAHILGQRPRRFRNVPAAAKIRRNIELHFFVVAGQRLSVSHPLLQFNIEATALTDHPQLHVAPIQFLDVVFQHGAHQIHQQTDLTSRPLPVFGTEGE